MEQLTNTNDEYLIHYGVLGMKWGVRKQKIKSGVSKLKKKVVSKRNATKKEREDAKFRKKIKKTKNLSKLTDAELKRAIQRIELEKKYSELSSRSGGGSSASSGAVKKVVSAAASKAIMNIVDEVSRGGGKSLSNYLFSSVSTNDKTKKKSSVNQNGSSSTSKSSNKTSKPTSYSNAKKTVYGQATILNVSDVVTDRKKKRYNLKALPSR